MGEPTSAYSFSYLIKRVAEEAGIAFYGATGQEIAMIPIVVHDLDLCKRIANDAIKMFIADAPIKGWRWMRRIMSVALTATRVTGIADAGTDATHLIDATLITTYKTVNDLKNWYAYILTGTGIGSYAKITAYDETTGDCTVAEWLNENGNTGGTTPVATDTFAITPVETINGDIARYPLPENFGGEVNGPIRYEASTAHASVIGWCDESTIRAKRSITVQTGYPLLAAILQFEPVLSAPSAKRRFELIVDPQPVAADTIEFPYTIFFDKLDLEAGLGDSGGNTTLLDGERTEGDDYFNDWRIEIISGTGKGSWALVDDYTGSSGTFTVLDWLKANGDAGGTNPGADSVYVVEPANNLHPAGYRFDKAILAACLAEAEMDIAEINAGRINAYIQKALLGAYKTDTRSAPRKLRKREQRVERTWLEITTDNDI